MSTLERRLRESDLLESSSQQGQDPPGFFPDSGRSAERDEGGAWAAGGTLEDGHLPFWRHSVPVLHLIDAPYPAVWHTMDDDAAHLDVAVIRDWARLLAVFIGEWANLDGYL